MQTSYSHKMLIKELHVATNNIRQANKGLPSKVKIDPDFEIIHHDTHLTMRINYIDGEGRKEFYNIAL